jgi:hypothetical protein
MNYKKIHDNIIYSALNQFKIRKLQKKNKKGYFELHHIVPRCLGGSDDIENLVYLTPEEHFVVHQLLVKLNPNNRSLIYAVKRMTDGSTCNAGNNKMYGWLRRKHANAVSEQMTGRELSDYQRQRISESNSTREISDSTKIKISESLKSHFRKNGISDELRQKRSQNQKGRKYDKSFGEAISARQKGKPQLSPVVTCPHCNKSGHKSGMVRWHFENCKVI